MELLSPEEQGTILMNLFRLQTNEEIILDTPLVRIFWASMESLLHDIEYEENRSSKKLFASV